MNNCFIFHSVNGDDIALTHSLTHSLLLGTWSDRSQIKANVRVAHCHTTVHWPALVQLLTGVVCLVSGAHHCDVASAGVVRDEQRGSLV